MNNFQKKQFEKINKQLNEIDINHFEDIEDIEEEKEVFNFNKEELEKLKELDNELKIIQNKRNNILKRKFNFDLEIKNKKLKKEKELKDLEELELNNIFLPIKKFFTLKESKYYYSQYINNDKSKLILIILIEILFNNLDKLSKIILNTYINFYFNFQQGLNTYYFVLNTNLKNYIKNNFQLDETLEVFIFENLEKLRNLGFLKFLNENIYSNILFFRNKRNLIKNVIDSIELNKEVMYFSYDNIYILNI